MDKKYEKNRWMVGWIKIYEKIWMVGLDGLKNI